MTNRISTGFRRSTRLGFLPVALALTTSPCEAQTFLPDPVERPTVAIQWEKPFLPGADALATYSSIFEADLIFPAGSGRSVQIGIPLAVAALDGLEGTSVYIGNLRASLLFGQPDEPSSFVGVTVPTASNVYGPMLAVLVGGLPWLGELEKWSDDAVSVSAGVLPSLPLPSGGRLGVRLGGAAVAPTDFENLLVFARAAGWGRLPAGAAELRADLGTSYYINGDDGFGQQFTAYLHLGAGLPDVLGEPGLFIRVPLDGDSRDVVDFSLGLSARF